MKEIEIKKHYQKKIKELKKHNRYYFEDSSPKISDKQYDDIKKEIFYLEKKYLFSFKNTRIFAIKEFYKIQT